MYTCVYIIHVHMCVYYTCTIPYTVTHTVHNLYKSWDDNLSATFVYRMTKSQKGTLSLK